MELDSIIQDMLYQQRNPKQGKKRLFQPEELENPHARWRINKESMGKYFKLSNIGINLHIPEYNKIQVAHKHSFFELIYVYRGRMKNQVDRTKIDLEQGDFCLMNPDAIHTPVTIGENALALNILMTNDLFEKSFMNLILDNQLLANFFVDSLFQKKQEKNYLVFSQQYLNQTTIQEYLKRILTEYFHTALYQQSVVESLLSCLFVELTRGYQKQLEDTSRKEFPKANLSNIIAYLAENYKTVTVQSVSEHFNYHPKYLPSLLKKYTGKGFSDIVQGFKLSHACQLLKQTDLSIADIVEEVGYSNRSYFYRVFQKQYQMTPSEYRKRIHTSTNLEHFPYEFQ